MKEFLWANCFVNFNYHSVDYRAFGHSRERTKPCHTWCENKHR